jgi:hypothetical protein
MNGHEDFVYVSLGPVVMTTSKRMKYTVECISIKILLGSTRICRTIVRLFHILKVEYFKILSMQFNVPLFDAMKTNN